MTIIVGFSNPIEFANAVLKNQKRVKGEQVLYYNMRKYKQKGYFDILSNISEHVTQVPLMDSLGNVNCAIIVLGDCIFESKYDKVLVINE